MDDVEMETPHGDPEMQTPHGDLEMLDKKTKAARDCRFLCILWIISVMIVVCIFVPIELLRVDTHYYVTIDSVSDLNPVKGLSFNLTLGVGSWSYASKACIKPGTHVEVSYHGVQLAASEAVVSRLCAGPRMNAEQRVVARETGVPVGHLMDSIMADMKQGTPVFDVTLHLPTESYGVEGRDSWVSGCGRKQVGTAATWCDAPNQEPTFD